MPVSNRGEPAMSHTEQRQARESDVTDAQRSAYWRERLADRPPALDLPVSQVAPPSLAEGRRQRTPFSLAGSLSMAVPARIDLSAYPNIRGWLDRVFARESWKSTSPKMG